MEKGMMPRSDYVEFIRHRLRIMGLVENENLSVFYKPTLSERDAVTNSAKVASVVVVIMPDKDLAAHFGVSSEAFLDKGTQRFSVSNSLAINSIVKPRTLCGWMSFRCNGAQRLLSLSKGIDVWISIQKQNAHFIFVGTDIVNDLLQYTQGDKSAVRNTGDSQWGFSHERPNYLFKNNIAGEAHNERFADHWSLLLASSIANAGGGRLHSILPGGAKGVVVLTGDDDQAYLEKYDEQLALINGAPITYFLHPETRHTCDTLDAMLLQNPNIDFGLHPDALDAPTEYSSLLGKQVSWFTDLVGEKPFSVRNHGYLNDGYWTHAFEWMAHDITFSSNVPGLNGSVITGSLLPGRLFLDGQLTDHWSLLTAIGDGILSELNVTDEVAADLVLDVATDIIADGIPGVIVCNLHPQNVPSTACLHRALLKLDELGFLVWNIADCHRWFHAMDAGKPHTPAHKQFIRKSGMKSVPTLVTKLVRDFVAALKRRVNSDD